MEGFELSAGVNANNVFLVKHSELEGRLDTGFYNPEIIKFIRWLESKPHTCKLKTFIKSIKTGFNNIQNHNKDGFMFLRTQNVRQIYLDFQDATFTNDETVQISNKGTLLFTRIGVNVGDVSFNNVGDCAISDNVICADLQDDDFAYFVAIFLSTEKGQWLLARQSRDTARPIISYENVKNLTIPIISQEKQSLVISTFESAYKIKQQKEQQAQALLDSIDGYLLNALGITLPEQDNRLEKRMFTVPLSEVTGGRIDPDIYFTKLYKIEGGTFANIPLHKLTHVNKGQSITSNHIVAGNYPVIAGGQSSPYSHNVCNYGGNIITVSASGAYAGFIWYHDYPIFASDCSVIQSKDEKILNTLYLAEILKTKQKEIYNLQQGAGQPHVYSRDLMKLQIAAPPLEKQNEIAAHISKIRAQAKLLQHEAAEVLATAKAEIERMILGEV